MTQNLRVFSRRFALNQPVDDGANAATTGRSLVVIPPFPIYFI